MASKEKRLLNKNIKRCINKKSNKIKINISKGEHYYASKKEGKEGSQESCKEDKESSQKGCKEGKEKQEKIGTKRIPISRDSFLFIKLQ